MTMTYPASTIEADDRPSSVSDAAAILDRLARHCAFACDRAEACPGEACQAWRLERLAADYLAAHWVNAEG
jgi:hypothetical protein